MFKIIDLFDLNHTLSKDYLLNFNYPWEALSGIGEFVKGLGKTLNKQEFNEVSKDVWVHKTASVAPTAFIGSPCIVGANTEIRHSAYIRGSVLIGKNCVIGNSTEVKNAILFDNVQIPHFNYAGDSIMGFQSHLGAGAKISNVKSDKKLVVIKDKSETFETGLEKVGAFVGDFVEVGCNSVLNPGTIVGKNTNIYPLCSVRGVVQENSIYKSKDNVSKKI